MPQRTMGLRAFIHRMTAPKPEGAPPTGELKMVFIVNHGLKMGKGKIAAQVGHVCRLLVSAADGARG